MHRMIILKITLTNADFFGKKGCSTTITGDYPSLLKRYQLIFYANGKCVVRAFYGKAEPSQYLSDYLLLFALKIK